MAAKKPCDAEPRRSVGLKLAQMNICADIRNPNHYEVRDASPDEIQQLMDAAIEFGLEAVPAGEFDDDAPQMTVIADTPEKAELFQSRFRHSYLG